jgi:threonine dehydratase
MPLLFLMQPLSELTKMQIYLKNDYKQFTGSFKERGACNTLKLLSAEQKAKGVIAASGNIGMVYYYIYIMLFSPYMF